MKNKRIHPILTGYTVVDSGLYCFHHSTKKGGGEITLPCFVFLIEDGSDLIMVDTCTANTERAHKYHHAGSYQPDGFAIHERLAERNLTPTDINIVIFTHLHWDHCYYMEKFTNAKFVVQGKEYEFAMNPIPVYYKSYEHPILGITRPFEGAEFDLVEGEETIVDGIRVFPSPGHSPGHQSIEIETRSGNYICCGDSIFLYENLKPVPELHYSITPPARFANIIETYRSIEYLKERAKNMSYILPTHEPELEKKLNEGVVFE